MPKNRSTSKTKVGAEKKFVRFYFTLVIDHVLPNNPKIDKYRGKQNSKSEEAWFTEYCESLASTIEGKLNNKYDGVVFKSYERHTKEKNVFTLYFGISKLHSFNDTEIISPRDGGFSIRARPLSFAKKEIRSHLYNSLCHDYYISDLSLKFVTSREFLFEIYFAGEVVVEREFSDEEIRNAEGVSNALEQFSDEMESALGVYFHCWPLEKKRRSHDNRYVFSVTATCVSGCNENEVTGPLAYIDSKMDADEIAVFGICNPDSGSGSGLPFNLSELREHLEIELPEVNLVSCSVDYVDQDDDVYDCNELLVTDA